mgnify:CR=1 FL=1
MARILEPSGAVGMARSTYHDQFHKLVDKGYLVPGTGNSFDFYEVPQTATQARIMSGDGGQEFTESPGCDEQAISDGQSVLPEDREINNNTIQPNNELINNSNPIPEETAIHVPEVKEIVIKRPKAEGRDRPKPVQEPKQMEFIF